MENEIKEKASFASWLSNVRQGFEIHEDERLRRFGLTGEEVEAWKLVGESATKTLSLPELHSMERHELCHFFHFIQDQILARVGLRALGYRERKGENAG